MEALMNRREFTATVLGVAAAATLPARAEGQTSAVRVTAVDTHAHVFHRGLTFIPQRRYTPDYDALPAQYLALLDANGMSHGVVIPISILGTDNSYTVEVLKQTQGRLRGLAVVDPAKDLGTLDALEKAGIVGVRLNLIGQPVPDVKSSPWKELVAECVKRDWQIEVYDDARRLRDIVTPLVDAGTKVVVDHFGKPEQKQGVNDPGFQYLLGLAASRRVWVKLSAPYRSSLEIAAAAAPLLRRAFGPERLMWGSDWPFVQFEKTIQYGAMRAVVDDWVPDPNERRIILGDTPARLFRF
jgi:predicted TIM-barrel fold metal-dependent hydrolase